MCCNSRCVVRCHPYESTLLHIQCHYQESHREGSLIKIGNERLVVLTQGFPCAAFQLSVFPLLCDFMALTVVSLSWTHLLKSALTPRWYPSPVSFDFSPLNLVAVWVRCIAMLLNMWWLDGSLQSRDRLNKNIKQTLNNRERVQLCSIFYSVSVRNEIYQWNGRHAHFPRISVWPYHIKSLLLYLLYLTLVKEVSKDI